MAGNDDVIRRLIIEAESRGMEDLSRELQGLDSLQQRMAGSMADVSIESEKLSRGFYNVRRSTEAILERVDPTRKELNKFARDAAIFTKEFEQNKNFPLLAALEKLKAATPSAIRDAKERAQAMAEEAEQAKRTAAEVARAAEQRHIREQRGPEDAHIQAFRQQQAAEQAEREKTLAQEDALVARHLQATLARRQQMAEAASDHELQQIQNMLDEERRIRLQQHIRDLRGPQDAHVQAFRQAEAERESARQAELARENALVERAMAQTLATRERMADEAAEYELRRIQEMLDEERRIRLQQHVREQRGPEDAHIEAFRRQQAAELAERQKVLDAETALVERTLQATLARRERMAEEAADHELQQIQRMLDEDARIRLLHHTRAVQGPQDAHIQAYMDDVRGRAEDENAAFDRARESARKYLAEIDQVAYQQQLYNEEVARISELQRVNALTHDQATKAIEKQDEKLKQVIRDQQGFRNVRANNLSNLGYQGFDVAQSVALGMPLGQVALQQGPQIAQILADMGRSEVKSLFSSLVGFLARNGPIIGGFALATAGIAAFYFEITKGRVSTEEALKRHVDLVGQLKDRYGEAGEAQRKYALDTDRVFRGQLDRNQAALLRNLKDMAGSLQARAQTNAAPTPGATAGFFATGAEDLEEQANQSIRPMQETLESLQASMRSGRPDIVAFRDTVQRLMDAHKDNKGIQETGKQLLENSRAALELQRAYDEAADAMNKTADAMRAIAVAAAAGKQGVADFHKELTTGQGHISDYARRLQEIDAYYQLQRGGRQSEASLRAIDISNQRAREDFQRRSTTTPTAGLRYTLEDVPEQYREILRRQAERHGIEPNLLATIGRVESHFNPNAVGPRTRWGNAQGMFQMLPGTQQQYGVTNPFDVEESAGGAARMLRAMQDRFGPDYARIAAGYHSGPHDPAVVSNNLSALGPRGREYVRLTTDQNRPFEERVRAANELDRLEQRALQRAEFERSLIGQTAEKQEELRRNYEARVQLQEQEAEQADELLKQAEKRNRYEIDSLRMAREFAAMQEIMAERSLIFATQSERAVAGRLQGVYGDEWQKHLDGPIAQQERFNEVLRETKDLASGALQGFVSDLRQGMSAGEAFAGVLSRIADRITSLVLERAISGMFGGGDANPIVGFINRALGAFGGNRASGGPVSRGSWYVVGEKHPEIFTPNASGYIHPGMPANNNGGMQVFISNNTPSNVTAKEEPDGRGGRRLKVVIDEQVAASISSPRGQQTLRSTYGVNQTRARR
jgi:soluble lytic murein transglycosylase-like protein